jgi:hypothetical protein
VIRDILATRIKKNNDLLLVFLELGVIPSFPLSPDFLSTLIQAARHAGPISEAMNVTV